MKNLCLAVLAAVVVLVAPELHAACATIDVNDFRTTFANDLNGDFNDYGRIFEDAGKPECAQNAMYALTEKVRNHLNYSSTTFTQWLDGYFVALIYGSALRLGEQGWASVGLDEVLDYNPNGYDTVSSRFAHVLSTPGSGVCDPEKFNTCMDDHAGSAAGFAWMAAYKAKRPNHNSMSPGGSVETSRNKAAEHIRKALASVCIREKPVDSTSRTPVCDGTVSDLITGDAETLSVNGNLQIIHYGFGLMTSVLSAAQGYEQAGGGKFAFSSSEQAIAKGLYEEIRKHANESGSYPLADCLGMSNDQIYTGARCDGVNAAGQNPSYLPNMYGLKAAYDYYFDGIIADTNDEDYRSIMFNKDLFKTEAWTARDEHFGYGRYATYGVMAKTWFEGGAPNMPGDAYDPIGNFDGISSSGLAQGWVCDQDAPNKRLHLDFYVDGWTLAAEGFADSPNEWQVSQRCAGGTMHRFYVQLPPETKGKAVRLYGIDYTWYGATQINCGSNPTCSW